MAEMASCAVCGEPAEDRALSTCNSCGERFHLNPRNDAPGKDCGTVWINEQYLALEFACHRCLDADASAVPVSRPRVLKPRLGERRYRKRS